MCCPAPRANFNQLPNHSAVHNQKTQSVSLRWLPPRPTASTPTRWAQFAEELNHLWQDLRRVFLATRRDAAGASAPVAGGGADAATYAVLAQRFFFLWVNFAPLTRGSAATAYAAWFALMLAHDSEYVSHVDATSCRS